MLLGNGRLRDAYKAKAVFTRTASTATTTESSVADGIRTVDAGKTHNIRRGRGVGFILKNHSTEKGTCNAVR